MVEMGSLDRMEFDGDGYVATYDWSVTDPSLAVVEVVAAAVGCRATDLDPLHGALDPDGLDALVAGGDEGPGVEVSFEYAGYELLVGDDGTVRATP